MDGRINRTPELKELFDGLANRITRLENRRFQVPVVTTDPTHVQPGDVWVNSTSNLMKVVNSAGVVKTITWT